MMDQDGSRSHGTNLVAREDEQLRQLLIERLTSDDTAKPVSDADEPLLSVEPVTRFTRITMASISQHKMTAAALFAAVALFVGVMLAGAPPQYQTTATVLLAGDSSLGGTEGTTSSAAVQAESVILNRDNLDAMVVSLGLAENEPVKPVLGRFRSAITSSIFGNPDLETVQRKLREQLQRSIFVTNDKDANLSITVVWADPGQAVAIAEESYQSFVRSRRGLEVEPLRDSVALLTSRADEAMTVVEEMRAQLKLSPGDGASAGSALESAVRAEQDLLEQLRIAEVRLDEAEAGVTVRYSLLAPPEQPDRPISGNLTAYFYSIVLAGIVTIGVFYLLAHPRGRVVHKWQLEDLGVRSLGTVAAQNRSVW